jgi:hypothetical protein
MVFKGMVRAWYSEVFKFFPIPLQAQKPKTLTPKTLTPKTLTNRPCRLLTVAPPASLPGLALMHPRCGYLVDVEGALQQRLQQLAATVRAAPEPPDPQSAAAQQ